MKHLILFSLLLLSITATAQFNFGLKIAYTENDLRLNPDSSTMTLSMIRGKGGLIAKYSFSKLFSLQTEINYNVLGKNIGIDGPTYINIHGDELSDHTDIRIRLQYLEVPLTAKFCLFSSQKVTFDIGSGVFAGYCLSAKQQINDESFQKTTSDYTTFNAGYTASLGLSVMKKRLFFEMGGYRG